MPANESAPSRPRGRKGKPEPRWRKNQKRWELRLIVQSGGRRHRKSIYGRTRQECLNNAKPYKEARSGGHDVAGLETALDKVTAEWLDAIEPPNPTLKAPDGLVHTTWVGYETHVRRHIDPYLGTTEIARLSLSEVEAWQRQLRGEGMSGSMRAKVLATLRTVLGWAIAHDYLPPGRNVASWAPMPAANRSKWEPIDNDGLLSILGAIKGHRLEAHFETALMLGPRLGELNGTLIEDLDLEERLLHINHTLIWHRGGLPELKSAKTPKSERTIALPDSLYESMVAHLERREAEKKAAGKKWQEYGLLFTRSNGAPLRGDGTGGVGDLFQRCLKRADLPERNFHQLRHQAASLLLALNGNNYFEVARILGHSTYRLTLDLYGHLIPEVQRLTAQAVDRFYRDLRSGNDPFQVIQGGVPGALDPALGRLRLA